MTVILVLSLLVLALAATSSAGPTPTFPPVGSIPRDFSAAGLEAIWDLVGPVQAPPFTTTVAPTSTTVALPSSPPPLYPSFYAPAPKDILPGLKFPPGFKFGVATAAYQVEGATKNEGKGPTLWDWNSRQPGAVFDNTTGMSNSFSFSGVVDFYTGDIVDLQYYLYKEVANPSWCLPHALIDVGRMSSELLRSASMPIPFPSISWARILPFGTKDSPINQAGLKHYSNLIDYHIAHGVEPVVTLFHWDTPLAMSAYYGGFTSPEVVEDFINYAKIVFAAYKGRVKTWYTFNEPRVFCMGTGLYPFNMSLASGVNASTAPYQCSYNLIKAHTGAVKAFREMRIPGEIALKSDDFIGIPWRSNSTDDALAVERHAAFRIGVFADPLYKTGDWPKIMTDTLPPEYLPRFTEQEKKDNLASADFFAIDAYREQFVAAPLDVGGVSGCVHNTAHPLWPECSSAVFFDSNAGWAAGISPDPLSEVWLQATPNTIRSFLKRLHERWPTNKLYISEFGFVEPFEELRTEMFRITEDVARTDYFMTYLGQVLLSIHEDRVPIAGAFAWSMVDNAEWNSGTSAKFGIQHVNYTTLERTYKRSALSLAEFFGAHLQH
ncbi:Glycoside hydrolase family 1 protein [Mycena indigotica]|uniref:Glycoside hydrolase family 1 protein n=1 Tax=Mycena indigotica TaxID=2126181 RepID=A0A8H6W5R4_9AGAR|nr:Glycoside hydrolase family 1 protein [Mycena indigotica]KAF7303811.1 Glycoside hydrolase family 1 protein [Mycena indigotica]